MRATRSRTKTSATKSGVGKIYYANGTVAQTINWTHWDRKSEMSDTPNGRYSYNECNHTVYNFDYRVSSYSIYKGKDLTGYGENWYGYGDYTSRFSLQLSPGNVGQFIAQALKSIKPKLKSKESVPNFLLELKDLKRSFSSIGTALDWLRGQPKGTTFSKRKFKRNFRKEFVNLDGKSYRVADLGDVASDIHLSTSFGINPFVSDVFGLINSYNDFIRKYDNILRHEQKTLVSHFTSQVPGTSASRWVNNPPTYKTQVDEEISGARLTLAVQYRYRVHDNGRGKPSLIDFAKYLGFRWTALPTIVWNAIPYSFVVDWVYKIGNTLDSLDEGSLPIIMEVLGGSWSWKYTHTCTNTLFPADSSLRYQPNPMVRWTKTHYYRGPIGAQALQFYQDVTPLPSTDKLSVKEISLALALGNKLRK